MGYPQKHEEHRPHRSLQQIVAPVRVVIDSIDSKVVELYLPELGPEGGECVLADVDVFEGVVTIHTEFAPDGHGRGEGVVCDVTFRAGTTDNVEDADEEWSSAWVVTRSTTDSVSG